LIGLIVARKKRNKHRQPLNAETDKSLLVQSVISGSNSQHRQDKRQEHEQNQLRTYQYKEKRKINEKIRREKV